jgi:S-adenosyl methyltransferase
MEDVTEHKQEVASEPKPPNATFDASVAHPARIYNYWLGGKDNFAADRLAAQEVLDLMPVIAQWARGNRLFLSTAVHYLAAEVGIRQFLDIGTGLPTADNTHEVAQRVAPDSRIVYVDNDPIVLLHARALLTSDPRGQCSYIEADAREVDKVLEQAAQVLDFSQPVAVMMVAVLHFIPDADDPYELTRRYLAAVPSGSYLAVSHAANDVKDVTAEASQAYNARSATAITLRSQQQFAEFLTGLDLVGPGIAPLGRWSPSAITAMDSAELPGYAALARKP